MDNESAPGPRLAKELGSWISALIVAVPVVAVLWFILDRVSGPWQTPVFLLLSIVPFVLVGLLSRSTLWALIVWLAPLVVVNFAFIALGNSPPLTVAWVVVVIWTGGIMLYESFGNAVFRAASPVFNWLIEAGLNREKRKAFRAYRQALYRNREQREAAQQLDDIDRTIGALGETALNLKQVPAPDKRWAELFEAAVAPVHEYAEMLAGHRPMDYDEANRLVARRQEIVHRLLRDESIPYRVLTFVPASMLARPGIGHASDE
jgi:hypothetical protein